MKKDIIVLVALCMSSLGFAGGSELYTQCKACHGAKAENSAHGASRIINTMSSSEIERALIGYKDGTYGGQKKSVMRIQALKLNGDQIRALALYISTLR